MFRIVRRTVAHKSRRLALVPISPETFTGITCTILAGDLQLGDQLVEFDVLIA
jgi:hypothetical protein